MKQLHGTASAEVAQTIERCYAVLADIERYPSWYPEVVRAVEVLDRGVDGTPLRAETKLHLSHGPLVKDFDLLLALSLDPPLSVSLARVPHGAPDDEEFEVIWRLRKGTETRIELELRASVAVPRWLPVGDVADAFAAGFVAAASRRAQTVT